MRITIAVLCFIASGPTQGASVVKCPDGTFREPPCDRSAPTKAAPTPAPDRAGPICTPGDWGCLSVVQGNINRQRDIDRRQWLDARDAKAREERRRDEERRYQQRLMDEARRGR